MKKNKMMRAASALLVAVLLTTCAVSGTFAKYVTEDSAKDSARVAKFGVVVTADGTLFEDTYKNAPTTTENEMTVVAGDQTDVVAPGTNNADDAFVFSVTGTPEVDVKVDVVVTEADNDIFLKAGDLPDMTADDPTTFKLSADYYPIKYTLSKVTKDADNKDVKTAVTDAKDVTLSELKAKLEALSKTYEANTDLAGANGFGTYEITWKWDYGTANTYDANEKLTGVTVLDADKADTLLGALATAEDGDTLLTDMADKYNLSTGLKVTITVTQVD